MIRVLLKDLLAVFETLFELLVVVELLHILSKAFPYKHLVEEILLLDLKAVCKSLAHLLCTIDIIFNSL